MQTNKPVYRQKKGRPKPALVLFKHPGPEGAAEEAAGNGPGHRRYRRLLLLLFRYVVSPCCGPGMRMP